MCGHELYILMIQHSGIVAYQYFFIYMIKYKHDEVYDNTVTYFKLTHL